MAEKDAARANPDGPTLSSTIDPSKLDEIKQTMLYGIKSPSTDGGVVVEGSAPLFILEKADYKLTSSPKIQNSILEANSLLEASTKFAMSLGFSTEASAPFACLASAAKANFEAKGATRKVTKVIQETTNIEVGEIRWGSATGPRASLHPDMLKKIDHGEPKQVIEDLGYFYAECLTYGALHSSFLSTESTDKKFCSRFLATAKSEMKAAAAKTVKVGSQNEMGLNMQKHTTTSGQSFSCTTHSMGGGSTAISQSIKDGTPSEGVLDNPAVIRVKLKELYTLAEGERRSVLKAAFDEMFPKNVTVGGTLQIYAYTDSSPLTLGIWNLIATGYYSVSVQAFLTNGFKELRFFTTAW